MPNAIELSVRIGLIGGVALNGLLTMLSFGGGGEGPDTSIASFVRYCRTLAVGTVETSAISLVACVVSALATPRLAYELGEVGSPVGYAIVGGVVACLVAVVAGGGIGMAILWVSDALLRRHGERFGSTAVMIVPWLGCQSGFVAFLLGLRIGWIMVR